MGAMHVILIFLDGIGLGEDDALVNPFAVMNTPTLHTLSGGRRWLRGIERVESDRAIFLPTDAVLGIHKLKPASGSGQATILTGRNISQEIGEHYGPKPSKPIRDILDVDNLFITLKEAGRSALLVTPHPPMWFKGIESGRRLPGSIEYAVRAAGAPLLTEQDYYHGEAISPDWTGQSWADYLGYRDAPIYTPEDAGRRLAELGRQHDFTMFNTWITDEIGHRGTVEQGVDFMETTDRVFQGLLAEWKDEDGLIVLTSDHGNMESIGERGHSLNEVPTLAIGGGREQFAQDFRSLVDITPGILRVLGLK
jgi:2,3-bisphosphoglycerate-independent phosphoglycerate mutase